MKKTPALFTALQKASMDTGRTKFFLFFLGFSFVLWFIAKFSKEYTEVIGLEMQLEDIPATIIPLVQSPQKVEFTLKASGFQFLYYQFIDNQLELNLKDADYQGGTAILPIAAQFQNLQEQLLGDTEIINYFPAIIEFDYQEQAAKTVPIVSPEFKMAIGYAITAIVFEPDSVAVIGPENVIKTINAMQPLFELQDPIKSSFEGYFSLPIKDQYTVLSQQEVLMKVVVDRFSEAKYQLPVEMINVPKGAVFKFFPKKATLTFSAPLSTLGNISPEDFKLGVDYNQLSDSNKSVKLTVFSSPQGITNMRIEPKEVQYLMRQ